MLYLQRVQCAVVDDICNNSFGEYKLTIKWGSDDFLRVELHPSKKTWSGFETVDETDTNS